MLSLRSVFTLVDAPSETPISLDDVKNRLRIDHDDDDAALRALIAAVVGHMDGPKGILGGVCLLEATYDQKFERWPSGSGALELTLSPVVSVTSVKYFDENGDEQTLPGADYEVSSNGANALIRTLTTWPALDTRRMHPVTVRYVAGMADTPENFAKPTVGAPLCEALMLHVGSQYEHRDALASGALSVPPLGYDDLTRPFARPTV